MCLDIRPTKSDPNDLDGRDDLTLLQRWKDALYIVVLYTAKLSNGKTFAVFTIFPTKFC